MRIMYTYYSRARSSNSELESLYCACLQLQLLHAIVSIVCTVQSLPSISEHGGLPVLAHVGDCIPHHCLFYSYTVYVGQCRYACV